jgi:hypothetical protein
MEGQRAETVISANAGIQSPTAVLVTLDARFRGHDDVVLEYYGMRAEERSGR